TGFSMMSFFFQAEDGIRDGHVTGVQTCALPICIVQPVRLAGAIVNQPAQTFVDQYQLIDAGAPAVAGLAARCASDRAIQALRRRSEERRVGKERGARWAARL